MYQTKHLDWIEVPAEKEKPSWYFVHRDSGSFNEPEGCAIYYDVVSKKIIRRIEGNTIRQYEAPLPNAINK